MSHLKPGKPTPNANHSVKKARCRYCDEKHPVDEMPTGPEGHKFCNQHCKSFYIKEEVDVKVE